VSEACPSAVSTGQKTAFKHISCCLMALYCSENSAARGATSSRIRPRRRKVKKGIYLEQGGGGGLPDGGRDRPVVDWCANSRAHLETEARQGIRRRGLSGEQVTSGTACPALSEMGIAAAAWFAGRPLIHADATARAHSRIRTDKLRASLEGGTVAVVADSREWARTAASRRSARRLGHLGPWRSLRHCRRSLRHLHGTWTASIPPIRASYQARKLRRSPTRKY